MGPVVAAIEELRDRALARLRERVGDGGLAFDGSQLAGHALALLSTELEACRHLSAWADGAGATELAIARAYAGEVALAIAGGIELGPGERVPLDALDIRGSDVAETVGAPDVVAFGRAHAGVDAALAIAARALAGDPGRDGLDVGLRELRAPIARFAEAEVRPRARRIHREDALIPMAVVEALADLGVFGLTLPAEHGGLGLGKEAMCVVTEELARAHLAVGSLATRSEIAGELVLRAGTDAQRQRVLPAIAAGRALPTAVFTEPDHGSDLARIRTRAERQPDGGYLVTGQKTWITHAARADLMTVLVRTDPDEPGYRGLSMLLADKTRVEPAPGAPDFVDPGLGGTEIEVLGYRGMREYELSFDGFRVAPGGLLGEVEGQGFKQLMQTFETARIQTAARAVGVGRAALEDAIGYARERRQFGVEIGRLPRVARKIAAMVGRVHASRQLTLAAARAKDSGRRCDLEAGMAKLLATRAAWECADQNVQVHGGNGYALEYAASRLLVDARVLGLFEGTSEIQAHVVARRLLEGAA